MNFQTKWADLSHLYCFWKPYDILYFPKTTQTVEIGRLHKYFIFHVKEQQKASSINIKQVQTKGSETRKVTSNL